MVGNTLGHCEILEPLSAGGMGDVYRVRDTKLDRDVAIKVLPEDFATDQDRPACFEHEAKLLASLITRTLRQSWRGTGSCSWRARAGVTCLAYCRPAET